MNVRRSCVHSFLLSSSRLHVFASVLTTKLCVQRIRERNSRESAVRKHSKWQSHRDEHSRCEHRRWVQISPRSLPYLLQCPIHILLEQSLEVYLVKCLTAGYSLCQCAVRNEHNKRKLRKRRTNDHEIRWLNFFLMALYVLQERSNEKVIQPK